MPIDDGGPAFARAGYAYQDEEGGRLQLACDEQNGMTLRDYFAAKALAGILADPTACHDGVSADDPECEAKLQKQRLVIASNCYHFADAMLVARKAGDA